VDPNCPCALYSTGTVPDLLIQTLNSLSGTLAPSSRPYACRRITLLALPYHGKGIIVESVVWRLASWNSVPALQKRSGAKAIQHTFSAQM